MREEGVAMSQDAAWLGQFDPFDPERARVREEIRQQAVRDATAATDAVRAELRRSLAVATSAKDRTTERSGHASRESSS